MMLFGHHALIIESTASLMTLIYIQVICSGRSWSLDTCLRCVCDNVVMFRASHDQFRIFHFQALSDGFRLTSSVLVVPLEIAQLGFSKPRSVKMVTLSDTSLYHTLTSSLMLSIQMMLGFQMLGYLSMTYRCRHLQLMSMTINAFRCLQLLWITS